MHDRRPLAPSVSLRGHFQNSSVLPTREKKLEGGDTGRDAPESTVRPSDRLAAEPPERDASTGVEGSPGSGAVSGARDGETSGGSPGSPDVVPVLAPPVLAAVPGPGSRLKSV